MKKIGILTFHRVSNFGAFLQAYALKETINSFDDCSAFLIDYHCRKTEAAYSHKIDLKHGIKNPISKILRHRFIVQRNRAFSKAVQSDFMLLDFQKEKERNTCDKYVVGSDQVWCGALTGDDDTYFLNFVEDNGKKTSYAASVGQISSFFAVQSLVDKIAQFSAISVREKELYDILETCVSTPLAHSIDPVFLRSQQQWRDYYLPCEESSEKYVLVFLVGNNKTSNEMIKRAQEYGKQQGLQVILLWNQDKWYQYRNMVHAGACGPRECLRFIDNAECVFTNSFHGTALSIIMNTPFYVESKITKPDRILNIIRICGLETRMLNHGSYADGSQTEIDWMGVQERLKPEIEASMDYIRKYIVC